MTNEYIASLRQIYKSLNGNQTLTKFKEIRFFIQWPEYAETYWHLITGYHA